MPTRLPPLSRLLTALAAVLLSGAFLFPLWRIDLEAPQYPEGLGLLIGIDAVRGVKPADLDNINGLNHYIGMKRISADAIPELRYMAWILGALLVGGLLVAAWARRGALLAWLGAFAAAGVAGLADFWRWGYDYGHDLDPHAIIQVPDMVYQPPIIGSKVLLNFTAHSWPAAGGILAGLAFVLGAAALVLAYRRPAARAVLLGALVTTAACAASGPRPVTLGQEECDYCRMTVTDARFAAEARTTHGRVHVFDSIECLASYAEATPAGTLSAVWVTDYDHPGTFVAADSATFWRVGGAASPMGRGLLATAGPRPAGVADAGAPLHWSDVLALMAREGLMQGSGAGHGHAD